jgi:hypothetical protein
MDIIIRNVEEKDGLYKVYNKDGTGGHWYISKESAEIVGQVEPLLYSQRFNPENDLSPYILHYACDEPCCYNFCPNHKAEFRYCSVSDIISITWRLGEDKEHTTAFSLIQFSMIEDFMKKLKVI